MSLLSHLIKFAIVLVLWTAIGQIPLKNESLENHYHKAVNSPSFQKAFWTLATPITWTTEKVRTLWEEQKARLPAR